MKHSLVEVTDDYKSSSLAPFYDVTSIDRAEAIKLQPELSILDDIMTVKNGKETLILPINTDVIHSFNPLTVKLWCHKRAVYQIVNPELVETIRDIIGERSAIEVGAGNATLGTALDIPVTDSFVQHKETKKLYELLNQPITAPPLHVQEFGAVPAAKHFKPQVIIGCFLTQKYKQGDEKHTPPIGSSIYGADHFKLLENCQTLILTGHHMVHKDNRIFTLPHKTYSAPWLLSRTSLVDGNRIWVFENPAYQQTLP